MTTPSDAQPVAYRSRWSGDSQWGVHLSPRLIRGDDAEDFIQEPLVLKSALDVERQKREAAEQQWREMLKAEHDLSTAYVRLRSIIPGALDTKFGPTAEEIWNLTEQCATALVARVEAAEASIAKVIQERDEALLVAGAAEDHANEWRHHCKTAETSLAKANARIAELEAKQNKADIELSMLRAAINDKPDNKPNADNPQ